MDPPSNPTAYVYVCTYIHMCQSISCCFCVALLSPFTLWSTRRRSCQHYLLHCLASLLARARWSTAPGEWQGIIAERGSARTLARRELISSFWCSASMLTNEAVFWTRVCCIPQFYAAHCREFNVNLFLVMNSPLYISWEGPAIKRRLTDSSQNISRQFADN